MFSGIVEEQARIVAKEPQAGGMRLFVETSVGLQETSLGSSVSVNGVCLTVVAKEAERIAFDVIPETLRCSNLGAVDIGSSVNLERSLVVGERLSGHFVSGHVDAALRLLERRDEGNAIALCFELPPVLHGYVVEKGSIALDGVALTIGGVEPQQFSVYIVPHTAAVTTLGTRKVGERVNCEIDIFARYVRAALQCDGRR